MKILMFNYFQVALKTEITDTDINKMHKFVYTNN